MSEQKVQVTISGDASGLLTALQQAAKGTEGMAKQMETAVGGVASMLEHFAAPLATFLGMLGGGALFKEAISEASELGDSLAKGAQKAGMSVEALSGLAHAAKLSHVAFDDLVGGLAKLAKNMQEAVFTPTSKAAAAFKALGIEVTDAQGHLRNSDEVLGEVAEKFKGFEDGAGKTALAMNLFGKSGAQMIPLLNEGKEGISELMAEAKRLGITMTTDQAKASEKYRDDMERVEAVMTGLKIRVSNEVMPALTRLAEWFTDKAPGMLTGITSAMRGIWAILDNTVVQVVALSAAITIAIQGAIVPMVMKAVAAFQTLQVQMALARMEGMVAVTSLASMLNPVFLATAAIVGLAFGYEHLVTWQSRAAEEHLKELNRLEALQPQVRRLTDRMTELDAIQKSGKSSVAAKKSAEEEEKTVMDQLLAIYPQLNKFLYDENGLRRSNADVMRLGNQDILVSAKNTLLDAESRLLDAKAMATQRLNHALLLQDLARATPFFAAAQANTARVMSDISKTIDTDVAAIDKARALLQNLQQANTDAKTKAPNLAHDDKPGKDKKDNSEAEFEKQLAAEQAASAAHWNNMAAISMDALQKEELKINLSYAKKLETARQAGASLEDQAALENARVADLQQARTDFEKKQAEERKKIAEEEAKEKRRILEETGTAQQGFFDGIQVYIQRQGTVFQQWSQAAQQMLHGVENAFSRGFQGILSGQMSLAQGLKSIWQGITGAIVQMLAQLAAKWIVAAIAAKIFKDSASDAAKNNAVAQQESAASTLWATYSGIPFVGPAIAAGFIAMMNASLVANAAGAKGIVGAAEGGWFDRPTMTMIGEGKRPELVVPDVAFKDFAANLSANILAQERQAQGYGRQAAGYAQGAAAAGGGAMADPPQINLHLNGPVLDTTQRGLRQLGNHVLQALQAAGQERGQILVPGRVYSGGM
jgi:lambda repressor-like predicted transcriptional regulator